MEHIDRVSAELVLQELTGGGIPNDGDIITFRQDIGWEFQPPNISVLSVKRFGAKGDGSTDDTAAVLAALAALGPAGGIVYFPPGIYKVDTESIILTQNAQLIGSGYLNTEIRGFGSGSIIQVGTAITATKYVQIRDIYIQGESTTASICINTKNVEACIFKNLFLGAGSISPSGGGGTCIKVEAFDNRFCQFNSFITIRCAAAAGKSIDIQSSSVGGAYNTAGFWSNIAAVGSGASSGERVLTVDGDSSSHSFVNCYFEPSNKTDASVRIFGANILMANVFIDGHPGKTALQLEPGATNFNFTGNIDGDIVNDSPSAYINSNLGMSFGRDIELPTPSAGTREISWEAGTSGDFGFFIRHDRSDNKLKFSAKDGVGNVRPCFDIIRSTGQFTLLGNFGSDQTAVNTNTPSGATARQFPVYNEAGALLGYIPIYGSPW